jgi:NAD(P)-dependent dehydrogenase (short-subunit alcohol dehydrogenase family)
MKILVVGESSKISKSLVEELKNRHTIVTAGRKADIVFDANIISIENISKVFSSKFDVYVFNIGLLFPKKINEQDDDEVISSISINLLFIVRACEFILDSNEKARILIVGSESGKKGSYDTTYFLAKSALRSYVREKRLESFDQQLLLISPSLILDAGMTERREDIEGVKLLAAKHPKGRYLECAEVSRLIVVLIESVTDYLTNTEIELNGGKFSRMING